MPYEALSTGVTAEGVQASTLFWGTEAYLVNSKTGAYVVNATNYMIVLDVQQQQVIAFREDLPNGAGITATRIIGLNGVAWNVTVREDSNLLSISGTALVVGSEVYLKDTLGQLGTRNLWYRSRVVDANYNAAIKQAGTRTIQCERFTLIDTSV